MFICERRLQSARTPIFNVKGEIPFLLLSGLCLCKSTTRQLYCKVKCEMRVYSARHLFYCATVKIRSHTHYWYCAAGAVAPAASFALLIDSGGWTPLASFVLIMRLANLPAYNDICPYISEPKHEPLTCAYRKNGCTLRARHVHLLLTITITPYWCDVTLMLLLCKLFISLLVILFNWFIANKSI